MESAWLKLTGLCSITLAIILFCVVVGGYSSISRSQGRIEASKSLLTDACEKRQALLPKLFEVTSKTKEKISIDDLETSAQRADLILKQVIAHEPPVKEQLIKEFEASQAEISQKLITVFTELESKLEANDQKQFSNLKKEFSQVQDYIFVTKKRYNNEVDYFNTRTNIFPGFLIAKIFGLDQLVYTGISKDRFLSGEKTFASSTS